MFFFIFLIQYSFGFECYQGNSANVSTITKVNCSSQCVSGKIQSLDLLFCGNCTNNLQIENVSCCNTSLCQTIPSAPPKPSSCEEITNKMECTSSQECFWCSDGISGDMCLTTESFKLPCWGMSTIFPKSGQSICRNITCPPPLEPFSLENQDYSYERLTSDGYPGVGPLAAKFGLMILNTEVRILNETFKFCETNEELINWCGANSSSTWSYCLVSEKWPQPDLYGWLQNTTFVNTRRTWSFYPSLCFCLTPGRAYYVPENPVVGHLKFDLACPREIVLLSFYILIAVLNFCLMLWVIWDLILLVSWTIQNKVDVFTSSFKVKILVILYCIIKITFIGAYLGVWSTMIQTEIVYWLKVGEKILLLLSHALGIFTFSELIIQTQLIGSGSSSVKFRVLKWCVFVYICLLLIGATICVGLADLYVRLTFGTTNVPSAIAQSSKNSAVNKSFFLLLIVAQGSLIFVCGALLGFVTYIFYTSSDFFNQRHMKIIFVRNVFLILAMIFCMANLVVFCYMAYIYGWTRSPAPDIHETEYYSYFANFWTLWADDTTEFLWMVAVAYSMRTSVNKSWIYRQFKTIFSTRNSGSDSSKENSTNMAMNNIQSGSAH